MTQLVITIALFFALIKRIHSSYVYFTPLKYQTCPNLSFLESVKQLNAIGGVPVGLLLSKTFPEFTHLNELLSNENPHSHITLTNFQKVDFTPSDLPIVVRNPEIIAVLEHPSLHVSWMRVLSGYIPPLKNISLAPGSRDANFTRKCTSSRYWAGINFTVNSFFLHQDHHDTCILLNINAYSLNTKSWTSQFNLGLYPPNYEYNQFTINYPRTFYYLQKRSKRQDFNIVPSLIPPVNICITDRIPEEISQDEVKGWMVTLSYNFYMNLNVLISNRFIIISVPVETSTLTMYDVYICQTCLNESVVFHEVTTIQLSSVPKKGTEQVVGWYILETETGEFSSNVLRRLTSNCEELSRMVIGKIFVDRSRQQQVEFEYAETWRSIMGNFTYNGKNDRVCKNGKLLSRKEPYSYKLSRISLQSVRYLQIHSGGYLYPVDLPNLVDRLRFVSCGQHGFSDLPYDELVSVFDAKVWLLTLDSLIAAAATISEFLSENMHTLT